MERNKELEIFDAKLDLFLRGKMSADEEAAFKNELSSKPELKERAKAYALMIREMQAIEKKNDRRIINTIASMNEEDFLAVAGCENNSAQIPVKKPVRIWPCFVKYAAAACVAAAVCFGGYRYYDNTQAQILAGNIYGDYEQYIYQESKGSDTGEIEFNLETLFAKVRQGKDIKDAISELMPLYEKAYNRNSDIYEYRNDIAWNLAMAYLKEGNRKNAVEILKRIIEDNREWPENVAKIQSVIDEINK